MRSIFRIIYVIMLTAIFLTFDLPAVSAGISSDSVIDADYDFSKMKNIFVIAHDTLNIPTEFETIIGQGDINLLEKANEKYVLYNTATGGNPTVVCGFESSTRRRFVALSGGYGCIPYGDCCYEETIPRCACS